MKKYLIPEKGNFYKANLHTHTTVSDGKMTPQEAKEHYQSRGYSIVAFTDHEVIVAHPELMDEDFIAITGAEFCVAGYVVNSIPICYHLNFLAKRPELTISSSFTEKMVTEAQANTYVTDEMRVYDDPRTYSVEHVNDMIDRAQKEGFLVAYNHPVWSTQNYIDYIGLQGVWGIECYNYSCTKVGLEDTMQPIEDLLHLDRQVFPLATDDAHVRENCFGGFVMVKSETLTYESVMTALERGDFYSSSGPELYSLVLEGSIMKISCSPVSKIYLTTDCRFAASILGEENQFLTEVELDITEWLELPRTPETRVCEPYFRITLVDATGKRAWTRAYHISELED